MRFSFQRKKGEEQKKPLTRSIKRISRGEERDLEKGRTAKAKERKGFSKGSKTDDTKASWEA